MRRLPRTGVGTEIRKKLSVPLIQRFSQLATISSQYSDGTATADLPVGSYTYQMFQMGIRSSAEIAGKTVEKNGIHFVKTANLAEFIEEVSLEIDGVIERRLDMDLLLKLNAFHSYDVTDGLFYMTFGGPNIFWDKASEDAYMLGTGDLRSLRLLFKLKSAWTDGSMFLEIGCEHARIPRPLEFINTLKSRRISLGAAGEHTITDLPINADISRLYVFGSGLKKTELVIDDQKVFDCHSYEAQGLNAIYGKDVSALGDCILFDFWRTGEVHKGLRSLESVEHRKRNASIALMLETVSADTEVRVVMELAGRYVNQA